jgi:homoserine acetyltransferase
LAQCLELAGADVTLRRVDSAKGHDSFLLEPELYEAGIRDLLG